MSQSSEGFKDEESLYVPESDTSQKTHQSRGVRRMPGMFPAPFRSDTVNLSSNTVLFNPSVSGKDQKLSARKRNLRPFLENPPMASLWMKESIPAKQGGRHRRVIENPPSQMVSLRLEEEIPSKQVPRRIPSMDNSASRRTCAELKLMSLMSMDKIPTKQEWLSFWYRDGSPKWSVPTKDEVRVVYTINVYGYYIEGSIGGYGVILRDNFGRPIVASSAVSVQGPVSIVFYELQGMRGGLQHVLDYKLVAYYIEILCESEITEEILRFIKQDADDIADATANSHEAWDNLKRFFDFHNMQFSEVFRRLIKEISELYVKLPESDIDVSSVTKNRNRAAEYVANMTQKEELERDCHVVTMKHGEFPVELQDILYEDAYEGPKYYSRTTTWNECFLNT